MCVSLILLSLNLISYYLTYDIGIENDREVDIKTQEEATDYNYETHFQNPGPCWSPKFCRYL